MDFYVLFRQLFICSYEAKNLSIHSISENGRNQLKIYSANGTSHLESRSTTSSTTELIFATVKGRAEPLRFFFVDFVESAVGLFLICGVVLRSSPSGFYDFKNSDGRYLWWNMHQERYIRESGGYVELSYTESPLLRESDQTYMDAVYPIQGCLLEVVEGAVQTSTVTRNGGRAPRVPDTKNRLLSLDLTMDSEGNPWTLSLMKRWTLRCPPSMWSWWTG